MNALLRLHLHPLTLLALLTVLAPAAPAQEHDAEESAGSTARVKFSDPAKPGTLKLALPWAEARVIGTDGNEVVVSSTLDQKGRKEVDREGFRRLDEDVTFELSEKDNVATVSIAGDNAWAARGAEFEIKVPRSTNLVLRTEVGGDISVEGVEGDIDINSMNGEVVLKDIASSAVVNTLNGEIRASFKRAPVKPVSLSSLNGEIEVRLPSDTKANLRMRTHNGTIRTNFPEGVLQTKTEKVTGRPAPAAPGTDAEQAAAAREAAREQARLDREQARLAREAAKAAVRSVQVHVNTGGESVVVNAPVPTPMVVIPPIPPIPSFGGKSIVGTLNGGGVDIKLTSMNGAITLREAK
jgi:hypothetical protein